MPAQTPDITPQHPAHREATAWAHKRATRTAAGASEAHPAVTMGVTTSSTPPVAATAPSADGSGDRPSAVVLRARDPRVEYHPQIPGHQVAGRIGGYFASPEQAVRHAELLAIDVFIPAAHPRLGFWMAPLTRRSTHAV